MIKLANRFDEYAYRVATRNLAPSVETLNEGQWITIDNSGEIIVSDGTKKSFMVIGSKRAGRDQVGGKSVQKVSYLFGNFEVDTDQFDPAGDYSASLTPLKVVAGGLLKPHEGAADTSAIVAYSVTQPVDGFLRIIATA